ncbi:hypothetical protein [Streptomyces albipurpureus]|uniref:Uncharacterized protein n=1 Tax=Streptomyces albipurpureus TaxID=2897419 RepID=A0ABT0UG37_9ACTN|nr:hypothetical protein [Streptomyces sp. CWNU-1]MCM2387375.1 hypothetical protein [Streptomyces sp. CWNU-1]
MAELYRAHAPRLLVVLAGAEGLDGTQDVSDGACCVLAGVAGCRYQ